MDKENKNGKIVTVVTLVTFKPVLFHTEKSGSITKGKRNEVETAKNKTNKQANNNNKNPSHTYTKPHTKQKPISYLLQPPLILDFF